MDKLTFAELRAECAKRGIRAGRSAEECRKRILAYEDAKAVNRKPRLSRMQQLVCSATALKTMLRDPNWSYIYRGDGVGAVRRFGIVPFWLIAEHRGKIPMHMTRSQAEALLKIAKGFHATFKPISEAELVRA